MNYLHSIGIENLGPYQVYSKREITSILRGIMETTQLVRMVFNKGTETIVTTILEVDEKTGTVYVDCGKNREQNQRIVDSDNISFETTLDRIRILFFSRYLDGCLHENRAAFCFAIPETLVRVQRREFYRVQALRERVRFTYEAADGPKETTLFLRDISAGGVGLFDEELSLDSTTGKVYEGCKIVLGPKRTVTVNLQVRNSQEAKAPNGNKFRRIGCQFVGMPNSTLMTLQRYITKLERDQNAKASGMV